MRLERGEGIESARRGRSVEENLRIWGEMFAATEEGESESLLLWKSTTCVALAVCMLVQMLGLTKSSNLNVAQLQA